MSLQRKFSKGMTLVEVTVATVVLSLIMLALVTALRTFGTTYSAVEGTVARISRVREVNHFLRHALRRADFPAVGAFRYEGNALVWLTPMDRVGTASGIIWLRLRQQRDTLMLDFAIPDTEEGLDTEAEPAWGRDIESEVLLSGLSNLSVDFRMQPLFDWELWSEEGANALPRAVRVTMQFEEVMWPPLVVALDGFAPET